ncbi:dephospho-CoA kinase [Spongiactinospora sp. TRM90649]|uniref:dephospho-CoA kinase n=1 Tax=Spongiactinospora sp. TRM90649 TaxID=3031114 RepID=UPI0023FA19ED|nr:dephospho-CoA kinase [Spongiactinospora sp. TRM90649]MDF5755956.1 dephospho-CoA kinase [Spongiactinospora sp. TRM90649]
MLKVGLTGGIGSGKTEVARRLAERGAMVIDADQIAREVVEPGTEGLARVVAAFGEEMLTESGTLNRERLGSVVFADPERLATLNGIVHPLVGERVAALQAAAPDDAIVVYDVPLLAENGLSRMYDAVIVVDASDEVRLERLVRVRGMSEADAKARMAAQATREARLALADHVVPNEGSLADLEARVGEIWAALRRQAAERA